MLVMLQPGDVLYNGRYLVKKALGSGGMADVYLAEDLTLGRLVAIKAPKMEYLSAELLARFRHEAKAVAALDHKAIVPLHDYLEQGGRPFLVMRYMAGGSLADRLDKGPYTLAEAVPVIERIAAALDYAHARRLIHRDVKPGNILFDGFDADSEAFLSDFGIARVTMPSSEETPHRLTPYGVVHGTFAYASPEALNRTVDHRADIYSLGVVLFEMLAGHVPYEARPEAGVEQLLLHVTEAIPSITAQRPDLPPSLQPIIYRVLAKEPYRRYASGSELITDLRRVNRTRPPVASLPVRARQLEKNVKARPSPDRPAAARTGRTKVGMLITGLIGLALLGLSAVLITRGLGSGADEKTTITPAAIIEGSATLLAPNAALSTSPPTDLSSPTGTGTTEGSATLPAPNVAISTTPPAGVSSPTATPEPLPTATAASDEQIHVVQPDENLYRIGLIYGFTAQELAAYNGLPNLDALDVGQLIRIPSRPRLSSGARPPPDRPTAVADVSPTRAARATPTARPTVTATSTSGHTITPTPILPVGYGVPVPQSIAVIGPENAARTVLLARSGGDEGGGPIVFSPDGRGLAAAVGNSIKLYSPSTLLETRQLAVSYPFVTALAFSPDGALLAWGTSSGYVSVTSAYWDMHDGYVSSIAFSPDEAMAASASYASADETIRLWRVADGVLLDTLDAHLSGVFDVAFSPDGETLASASDDHRIWLWRTSDGAPVGFLKGHSDRVRSVAYSPDGQTLASGSHDGTVRLWRVSDGEPIATLAGHSNWVWGVEFSPDGRTLASASADGTIRLWDAADGELLATLADLAGRVFSIAFSPDGLLLASASDDGRLRLWGVPDWAAP